jgi:hypothetical protein
VAALLLFTLSSASCKRQDKGGKGGEATLKVTPQHHGKNINDCVIYLKYDKSTPPSATTEGYDENVAVAMEGGKPVATFTKLKKGKYYIYGYGYDPDISQNVKGGVPYEITSETVISVNVPVTEGD